MILRLNFGRYLLYTESISGIFFFKFLSISIRLNLPVEPARKGSLRANKSRMVRGAPLSERRPERMTFESRKTLTALFTIGFLI